MGKLIYLACPYTHNDPDVMRHRFNVANKVAARLMKQGKFVFSPISHTHPIACVGKLPKNWRYWKEYDKLMLSKCDSMMIIKIDGFIKSVGVNAERKLAEEMGIEITEIEPLTSLKIK